MNPTDIPTSGEITGLLVAWRGGDRSALDRLFPMVYDELRLLARRQIRKAGGGQTLATTALIHEAYIKLVDQTRALVEDRHHFFALASKAMRHILVDHARRRGALKRGAAVQVSLSDDPVDPAGAQADEIVEVDRALAQLETVDPRLGQIVEMRFFGGLSVEETAEALTLSPRTVKRDWQKARAFLYAALKRANPT